MSIQDFINGSFESLGSWFILTSIVKLYKDKKVRGVSYFHIGFFSLWGLWNLYYYPYLSQWFSFVGGCGIAITNSIYTGLLIYYSIHDKEKL